MLTPVRMKKVEIILIAQDVTAVIKRLGKTGEMQFDAEERRPSAKKKDAEAVKVRSSAVGDPAKSAAPPPNWVSALEKTAKIAAWLEIALPEAPLDTTELPTDAEYRLLDIISKRVSRLDDDEYEAKLQKNRLESMVEAMKTHPPLADDGKPASNDESIAELEESLAENKQFFDEIDENRRQLAEELGSTVAGLRASFLMARMLDTIKDRVTVTANTSRLSGWVRANAVDALVDELVTLTGGRAAIRIYEALESPGVVSGTEKIPIALSHGNFAKNFQGLVTSYGSPVYAAIDPTPISAFFFCLLFAVMFGDVGQGAVLAVLGFYWYSPAGRKKYPGMTGYAGPMRILGILSMFTGLLYGSVFSNETLLEKPTEFITAAIARTAFGIKLGIHETGHLLHLMPDKDNLLKLAFFFVFTLSIGVIILSVGLILNIINSFRMNRTERALFSKNGIAGLVFFWYAVSIAARALIQKSNFVFGTIDIIGLAAPVFFIVTGQVWYKLFTGGRPLFPEGVLSFIIEGIVEILETVSGYISSSVSFLRVGAFALSHAVLSFIIFTMANKVAASPAGGLWQLIIIIAGNALIIVLEGMIVAIQVVRLQYYEFFSKFFTDTGAEFSPFRFSSHKNELH